MRDGQYELNALAEPLVTKQDIANDEQLKKHAHWVASFQEHYECFTKENVYDILQSEIGVVFEKVLECAGVYKCTTEGRTAFLKLIDYINNSMN